MAAWHHPSEDTTGGTVSSICLWSYPETRGTLRRRIWIGLTRETSESGGLSDASRTVAVVELWMLERVAPRSHTVGHTSPSQQEE